MTARGTKPPQDRGLSTTKDVRIRFHSIVSLDALSGRESIHYAELRLVIRAMYGLSIRLFISLLRFVKFLSIALGLRYVLPLPFRASVLTACLSNILFLRACILIIVVLRVSPVAALDRLLIPPYSICHLQRCMFLISTLLMKKGVKHRNSVAKSNIHRAD